MTQSEAKKKKYFIRKQKEWHWVKEVQKVYLFAVTINLGNIVTQIFSGAVQIFKPIRQQPQLR